MIMRPGYGLNLDDLVNHALAIGEPNHRVKLFGYTHPQSLLVMVAIVHRLDLAEDLFKAGATMTADDLAHVIWWWSDASKVEFLLDWGTPHNDACLHHAIRHGKWDVVLLLIERGANLSARYFEGQIEKRPEGDIVVGTTMTLLHTAVLQGQTTAIRKLLERGIAVDERDTDGFTPLMMASRFYKMGVEGVRQGNVEAVFWLLKYGADPNVATPSGETPLLLYLGVKMDKHIGQQRTDIAKMLLRYGANPNVLSPRQTTPIMFAARDNYAELVTALLLAGADPGITAPDGRTALDVAITRQSKEAEAALRAAMN